MIDWMIDWMVGVDDPLGIGRLWGDGCGRPFGFGVSQWLLRVCVDVSVSGGLIGEDCYIEFAFVSGCVR